MQLRSPLSASLHGLFGVKRFSSERFIIIFAHSDLLSVLIFRFYTYGDMPLAKHLESIEELALRQFSKIDPGTDIPSEPRWTQPVRRFMCYLHTKLTKLVGRRV